MAKKKNRLLGLSIWKWANILGVVIGVLGGLAVLVKNSINFANNLTQEIRAIERRTDEIEVTMKEIRTELKQTSDLLHADLSWRYLYQHDQARKHLAPRYDPLTRTLEFIDTTRSTPVRNP